MMTMGTFPLSLIALGQIRRRHFDDTLTLRSKRTINANEEPESPQQIEMTRAHRANRGNQARRVTSVSRLRTGRVWLAALPADRARRFILVAMLPR